MILIDHRDEGKLVPYFYWGLEQFCLSDLLNDEETYFFMWPIHGVIIGKNQILENEVNLDYTSKNNIPVYRRYTGGGAVYADKNNLMFTIARKKNKDFSFKKELEKIVKVLNDFGIPCVFGGRNDILIDGKKISGNAFSQTDKGMIIHGTLLFDTDLETMVRSITPNNEKLISKGIDSVRSRVCNVKDYCNGASIEDLRTFIERKMCKKTLVLNEQQIETINEIGKKYSTKDWIYREQPTYSKTISQRLKSGTYKIDLDIRFGEIIKISITGDFFEKRPIKELEAKFIDQPFSKSGLMKLFSTFKVQDYLVNEDNNDLLNLFLTNVID